MSKVVERAKNSAKVLRQERARVFKAFDIYKQNVNYGLVEENEQEHENIKNWYNAFLDLTDNGIIQAKNAIENVPEKVKKYL